MNPARIPVSTEHPIFWTAEQRAAADARWLATCRDARKPDGRAIRRRVKAGVLKRMRAPMTRGASKADLVDALSAYPGFAGLVRHGGSIDDVFVELYAAEWSRAWNRPTEEFFELFGRGLCAETLEPELL